MSIAGVYTSCIEKDKVDYRYLKSLGLNITVKDEYLIIKPKNKLTPELITAIKNNKQTIIKQFADDVINRALNDKLESNDPNYIAIFSEKLNRQIYIALDRETLIKLAEKNRQALRKVPIFHINDIIIISKKNPDKETLGRLCLITETFNS